MALLRLVLLLVHARYTPHKAIHNTKNSKGRNFNNGFDIGIPNPKIDHWSEQPVGLKTVGM